MGIFSAFENKDRPGTYDGAAMMASITGISRNEIAWMARRTQELLKSGMPKGEVKDVVMRESREIRKSGGSFT